MANDLVGDIVRVTIAAVYTDAQVLETNIAYRCKASGGADSRALLGAAVYGYFVGNWAAVMSTQCNLYGWKVAALDKAIPPLPVSDVDPSVGIGTGSYLPTQARPILRLKTASAGPKYRGRMYLFTPDTTFISAAGFPTIALNNATNALGTALIADQVVGGSTWEAVIAHLIKKNPTGTTATHVTAATAAQMFGTIRKSGNTGRINTSPW